tara:strand:+ start:217 stop:828 length:612 start_codon:yes stop_codon:yes gene_type:complete
MKYVIEDDINFFDELNNIDDDSNNNCLIENKPLTDNFITLSCNHKFNYLPLYNEVIKQKTKYNPNETTKLKIDQIKCPYCRQITNNILPFICGINSIQKINGVTIPNKFSLQHKTCSWIYKSGKNKGKCCNDNGFVSNRGNLCEKHWNLTNKKDSNNDITWTNEMRDLYNNNTVVTLKQMLRDKNLIVSGNKLDLVIRLSKKC